MIRKKNKIESNRDFIKYFFLFKRYIAKKITYDNLSICEKDFFFYTVCSFFLQ